MDTMRSSGASCVSPPPPPSRGARARAHGASAAAHKRRRRFARPRTPPAPSRVARRRVPRGSSLLEGAPSEPVHGQVGERREHQRERERHIDEGVAPEPRRDGARALGEELAGTRGAPLRDGLFRGREARRSSTPAATPREPGRPGGCGRARATRARARGGATSPRGSPPTRGTAARRTPPRATRVRRERRQETLGARRVPLQVRRDRRRARATRLGDRRRVETPARGTVRRSARGTAPCRRKGQGREARRVSSVSARG